MRTPWYTTYAAAHFTVKIRGESNIEKKKCLFDSQRAFSPPNELIPRIIHTGKKKKSPFYLFGAPGIRYHPTYYTRFSR